MLSPYSITTKLMAIVVVIGAGYALLIGLFLFTLNHIKHTGDTVLDRNVARLTENAKLGRELVFILTDTNHVTTSFYTNDDFLKKESKIVITKTDSLIPESRDVRLTKILEEFAKKVHLVFKKCFAINKLHSEIDSTNNDFKTYVDSIKQTIDSQMIKRTIRGENVSNLRKLRQLVPGIHATVGNIDYAFNLLGIEYFKTTTIETDHIIFNLIDDLSWRIQYIDDAEPSLKDTCRQFMEKINNFKQTLLVFNMNAKDLHKSLMELNIKKNDLLKYMEATDHFIKEDSIEIKRKMTDAFLLYRKFILIFSISLVLIILIMAVYFIMSNIKKPMALINEGLESIRKGNLNTKIKLNRKDEWAKMETALNRMVSELKSLYDKNEESRDNLEKKVIERTRDLETINIELEIAQEASDIANKAKSTFIANMSHEFRTPLNAILGYAQIMLRKSKGLSSDLVEDVNIIRQSGEHLLILINDILDISKIEAGKMELFPSDIHLPDFLDMVASIIRARAEKKDIGFISELGGQLPQGIKVDEVRLRQILLNLLGNAIKFTQKGKVTLRVTGDESGTRSIKPETSIRFEVADTGPGISPEQMEKIFKPFEQTGDIVARAEGSGLGLAITSKLVNLMGGEIGASSKVGKGSIFWFKVSFPIVDVITKDRQIVREILGYEGGCRKVLVADDNRNNRMVLFNLLERLGFEVIEAENGQEAVTRAIEIKPDLVLMDLVMPVMTGFEATNEIRKKPDMQDVPIIAVSASAFESDKKESQKAGCKAFLPKPVDENKLYALLEKHLNLTWIYAETPDKDIIAKEATGPLVPPPPEEMAVLYELALIGNMGDIQKHTDYLSTLGEQYVPFAEKLGRLAENFQERAVMEMVEKYMEGGRDETDL